MILDEELYLEHYGVKGMRWGVRNEYKKLRDKRRKANAQKYLAEADFLKTRIKELEVKREKAFFKGRVDSKKRGLTKDYDQAIKDAEAKAGGKLTDKQKKLLIGAGIVGGMLLAYGAYHMIEGGDMNRMLLKGAAFLKNTPELFDKSPYLAKPDLSLSEIKSVVVAPVNPDYGDIGTLNNCRRATFAYEMRRRGFDVRATKATRGRGQSYGGLYGALHPGDKDVPSTLPGAFKRIVSDIPKKNNTYDGTFGDWSNFELGKSSFIPKRTNVGGNTIISEVPESIFRGLSTQPNRSRGEIGVGWKGGGLHSMAYEVVDGKPSIFDAQSGKVYSSAKDLHDELGPLSIEKAGFTRLDDVDLSEDFLAKWVTNVS